MCFVYFLHCPDLKLPSSVKIGSCKDWKNRKGGYITCSPYNGPTLIYLIKCIKDDDMIHIEIVLHDHYKNYNTRLHENYRDGGTEWFIFNILPSKVELSNILNEYGFEYEIISGESLNTYINEMNYAVRKYKYDEFIKNQNILDTLKQMNIKKENFIKNSITRKTLREYQTTVIKNACIRYYTSDKLILNWACGLGKTLTALHIAKYFIKNTLVIGIPSNILLLQWLKTIIEFDFSKEYVFLIISSNKTIQIENIKYLVTTKPLQIKNFLNCNDKVITLTTYHSAYRLNNYTFDFGILDECHHLCGELEYEHSITNSGKFTDMLKIKCQKSISLSATLKSLSDKYTDNFDVDVFGIVLDEKSVKWAIENNYITDYRFITLRMNILEINEIISKLDLNIKNIELFLSAYITIVQAMLNYNKNDKISHILVYCNTIESAKIVTNYIDQILKNKYRNYTEKIYNKTLSSADNFCLNSEVNEYKNSDIGIISCVYIFGEGIDYPFFNACTVAENITSVIRLIQSLFRANRLNIDNNNKIASYMCPFIDSKTDENKLCSFKKIKDLLIELNKIDSNIIAKINYAKMVPSIPIKIKDDKINFDKIDFDKINTENIKTWIRHRKVLDYDNWDENEYYLYQTINKKHNITEMDIYDKSKITFENEGIDFIPDPKKYFTGKAVGVWKCEYDFLGVDTSKFPHTKELLKKICIDNNITSLTYSNLYEKYNLPKNPAHYYKDFKNLENLLNDEIYDDWEF
jgi:superfamily II DNA or RNA helicase